MNECFELLVFRCHKLSAPALKRFATTHRPLYSVSQESVHCRVVSDWAKDVQTDIETATVTAIAEALATAKQTSIDDECFAVVVVGGSTPNNVAACASTGFAASMNKVEDAVATAGVQSPPPADSLARHSLGDSERMHVPL